MAELKSKIELLEEKIKSDVNIKNELSKTKDIEEFIKVINSSGIDITKEEFLSLGNVQPEAAEDGSINDEDLESVAGGFNWGLAKDVMDCVCPGWEKEAVSIIKKGVEQGIEYAKKL